MLRMSGCQERKILNTAHGTNNDCSHSRKPTKHLLYILFNSVHVLLRYLRLARCLNKSFEKPRKQNCLLILNLGVILQETVFAWNIVTEVVVLQSHHVEKGTEENGLAQVVNFPNICHIAW